MTLEQYETTIFKDYLASFTLSDAMCTDVLTVYEGWSIRKLSQFFSSYQVSGAPVVAADNELVGVVTHSDIVRFESQVPSESDVRKMVERITGTYHKDVSHSEVSRVQQKANDYCVINSIMTNKVESVDIHTSLVTCAKILTEKNIHRLFVTNNNALVGVITAMDILKLVLNSKN